ncbi:hypothetical protein Taro_025320, partial [Colocasia esculenta]|nr:hypothetical protein [Colocasia esculenta]
LELLVEFFWTHSCFGVQVQTFLLLPRRSLEATRSGSRRPFVLDSTLYFSPFIDMASRGRRGVPTREGEQRIDEPRREDQGEQQAPAPQGPVLPPPPLVDYGVSMQGLVQAMQTQAHTQAALQAQLEAQAQVPVPQAQDHGGPSIMERSEPTCGGPRYYVLGSRMVLWRLLGTSS